MLTDHLKMTSADCARAMPRLISEHLIRRVGADEIAGLHELRSQCILETCLELAPGSAADAWREALAVVSATGARTLIAAALRLGQLDEQAVVNALVVHLRKSQEPELLIGGLEGLKLSALSRDADLFKSIADVHGVAARFYFLIIIVMQLRNEDYAGSKLEVLAKIRDEFMSRRGRDCRNDLLSALDDNLYSSLVGKIGTLAGSSGLLRSLVELDIGQKVGPLRVLAQTAGAASLEDIAALLAIAEELSPTLLRELVAEFGGSDKLLARLWTETPWAIKPRLEKASDGANELYADLLAIDGRLVREPDAIVYEHAARALVFAPDAERITSRPVQISGEPIVIKEFTPGLKSFRRGNNASQASITWNRMLIHTVSLRYAASSTTEVMQRRKESIEIAARLFAAHADRRCRGRKLTRHADAELKALNFLEEFFPPLPLAKPEVAMAATDLANLLDSASDLITDVAPACRRMYNTSVDGLLIAYDMERIAKAVSSCRSDVRWNYVGGAPTQALDQIERMALNLYGIFRATSKNDGVAHSLVTMPPHQTWAKGTGVAKAHDRAQLQAERKIAELKLRLTKSLSDSDVKVHATSARLDPKGLGHWPDHDICVLAECVSYVSYYEWLGLRTETLKSEAERVTSLVAAPVVDGQVIAPCAVRILTAGLLPEPEFSKNWTEHLGRPCFTSPALNAFEQTFGNLLIVHGVTELLDGRALLDVERSFIDECRAKADAALAEMSAAVDATPTTFMVEVLKFLRGLDNTFSAAHDRQMGEKPAVEIAREVVPTFEGREPSEIMLAVLGTRMALIRRDVDQLPREAA